MTPRQPYWIGSNPANIKRWQNAESGWLLEPTHYSEQLLGLYRRNAKQWNDIELDNARSLSEHTHRVWGAKAVGSSGQFILCFDTDPSNGWILELNFSRQFRQYYPGYSTGLNAPLSPKDIKDAVLHWRGNGQNAFNDWLIQEYKENEAKGEWAKYKI